MDKDLLFKYNIPGPRYTSYPTVPYWQPTPPTQSTWTEMVQDAFRISNKTEGISLYIHLPFCESLCTYCGCNTRITINHSVENHYIKALKKEWQLYLNLFGDEKPILKEIHLGGGTPTFFSSTNLTLLIEAIFAQSEVHPDAQFSFEAHPGNTTDEHLFALFNLGFRRISIGVQDFNPLVLAVINRHQSYEQVKHLTDKAREIGYNSINYDIIYGLPLQKSCYMMDTMMKVIKLKPDRIAFYSYAHVPWLKPGQRKYTEEDLPDPDRKMAIYETGKNALELAGYQDIGMDHFALANDSLYHASQNKTLHRNFMGYTDTHTQLLIGLGASSISDTWDGYVQNEKKIEDYYQLIEKGMFPIMKGHELTEEDLIIRKHILRLMTRFETTWYKSSEVCDALLEGIERLAEMETDGLINRDAFKISVTPAGRPFIRNICMAFDAKLHSQPSKTNLFSQTV